VFLLDAASLGGGNHSTPLHASTALGTGASTPPAGASTSGLAADALTTWQELTITPAPAAAPTTTGAAQPPAGPPVAPPQPTITYGARWLLAPVASGIVALKVTDAGGSLALEHGWTAQGLPVPETPIVVNGVVFALASGRPSTPAGRGTPAVLHAYDGTSGKELWTSGKVMTTPASPGSFWSAMSQVYVGSSDGTLHAFGFLDERR
jgi:hypothetical protein